MTNFLTTPQGSKTLDRYLKKMKSDASRRVYRSALTRFFDSYGGDICGVTSEALEQYRNVLAEKHTPRTAKREFSILNGFFKFISRSKISKGFENPIVRLKDYAVGNYAESPEFKAILDNFLDPLPAEKTKFAYRFQLTAFFTWLNKPVHEVTLEDLKSYRDHLRDQEVKASTFWAKFIPINRLYKFLTFKKGINNPVSFLDLQLPMTKKRKDFYTLINKGDVLKLLKQPDRKRLIGKRDYAVMLMIAVFGLRINEATRITFGNFEERIEGQVPLWIMDRKGKGVNRANTRIILNGRVLAAVDDWMTSCRIAFTPSTPLFLGFHWSRSRGGFVVDKSRLQKALSPRTIEYILDKYIRLAGIRAEGEVVSGHALRHFAISALAQSKKVKLEELRELAGHTDIRTTQIYIHYAQSLKDNAGMHSPIN